MSFVLVISSCNLLLERIDSRRQKSIEFELIPFFLGECRSFVEVRCLEKGRALQSAVLRPRGGQWKVTELAFGHSGIIGLGD